MDFARLVALSLGVIFGLSAALKMSRSSYQRFETATAAFLPGDLRPRAAAVAPLVLTGEVVVAVLLLAGFPSPRIALSCALVLLVAFTAALLNAVRNDVRTPCACFGSLGSSRGPSVTDVARNALFGSFACAALVPRLSAVGSLVVAFAFVVVAAALAWWLAAGMRKPESFGKSSRGHANALVGKLVPSDLRPLLPAPGRGMHTIFALLTPGCGGCQSALPYLADMGRSPRYEFAVGYGESGASEREVEEMEDALASSGLNRLNPLAIAGLVDLVQATQFPVFVALNPEWTVIEVSVGLGRFQLRHPYEERLR